MKAFVFDAYGTLFDVDAAVGGHHDALGEAAGEVSALWRRKQLEYTWLRSLMGDEADFEAVTRDALEYALEAAGTGGAGLVDGLLAAYRTLPAHPDARPALAALRERGAPVAILSNGTPEMLAAVVGRAGLDDLIDPVISAVDAGVFKPDRRVYDLACRRLGLAPDEITFVSANGFDVAGGGHFGFRSVWIDRTGQTPERLPAAPHRVLASLAELAELST